MMVEGPLGKVYRGNVEDPDQYRSSQDPAGYTEDDFVQGAADAEALDEFIGGEDLLEQE
jgi:hypothetical protein